MIADNLKKHVDPSSPAPVRIMAAKAMVPMAPRDQVHVVYQLTFDAEPKIAKAARKSFKKFPEQIVEAVIGDDKTAAPVLGLFAHTLVEQPKLLEKLLLNRRTPDSAFVQLAATTSSESITEIIANNQERLLREEGIVRALRLNECTLKSTLDRVIDFMVRSGVLLKDIPEFAESFSRLNQKELEAVVEEIDVPLALLDPEEQARLKAAGKVPKPLEMPPLDADDDLSLDDLDLLAAAEELEQDLTEEKKQSVREMLRVLTVAQQVKVAMMGNKEVRSLLLRSTVRMIAEAAIRSPRITEMEVINAASSRSVQDVVIRQIARNREWTRLYQVKLALCNNPKTPLATSMQMLRSLRLHDLKSIGKSKNIPSALVQQAKRFLKQKSSGR